MPKIPDWNAPAPQVEWLRWAQGEIERLGREVERGGQTTLNDGKTQNATIGKVSEQIAELAATQAALEETVAYLQALSPVSAAGSGSGIAGFTGWTATAAVRPSVSVTTPTGKILVTVSATLNRAVSTFSIAGYVDRDAQIAGTGQYSQAYGGGSSSTLPWTATRTWVVTGLPVGTPITVQSESYGLDGTYGTVSGVSITAQPIP